MWSCSMLLTGAVLLLAVPVMGADGAPPVSVLSVRYRTVDGQASVMVGLDRDAGHTQARLTDPDRLYLDILNAKLNSPLMNRTIPVGNEVLKQVRVSQNRADMVRIVLDLSVAAEYSVLELHDPFRLIISPRGRPEERFERALVTPASFPGQAARRAPEETISGVSQPTGKTAESPPVLEAEKPLAPAPIPDRAVPRADHETIAESSPDDDTPAAQASPQPGPVSTETAAGGKRDPSGTKRRSSRSTRQPAETSEAGRPLTITGTLSVGYYNAYTRGGGNDSQLIRFAPADAIFDINGYYLTPDLIDYWVQPELNSGGQASDAGFQGGNGVRMRVAALRRQILPVTVRYSNVQLTDVYFGSLSQLSTYTRKNRNKDLGVTAELQRRDLPSITADWGTSSVNSRSGLDLIPDFHSRSNHLSLDGTFQRWGWDFRAGGGRQQQTSDLFAPQIDGNPSSALKQTITQVQGSARHSFMQDSELTFDGGSQSSANVLLNQPIDLTTRNASANLRLFQRRRWKSSIRVGYTSNLAGLLLTRLVGGLGGSGSIAPEEGALLPFRHSVSYLNINGLTSVDLPHGLGLYGSVDRTAVVTASDAGLSSRYLSTAGGATYTGTNRWGTVSAQYGRSFGIGSVTGQTGRILGQTYLVTAQPGKWDRLQIDLSVRGNDQKVLNELPAEEHSLSSEGNLGLRLFGGFRGRIGGGWQRSTFANTASDFRSGGYTGRAAIEHPRFQLSGSLNTSVGNSLQAYGQLFSGIATGAALLSSLRLAPSDLRGITCTLHAAPLRRIELSGLWTRSLQHLEGVVVNDFEVIDAYATLHFRKLQLQAGFFRSRQIYTSILATYPETERGRYYIRLTRTAKFL